MGGDSVTQGSGRNRWTLARALAFACAAFLVAFVVGGIHEKDVKGLDVWLGITFLAAALLLPTLAVVITDHALSAPLVLVCAVSGLILGGFFPYAMNWWGLDVDHYNSSSDAPGTASLWFQLIVYGFCAAILGFVAGFVEWLAVRFVRARMTLIAH